jgi:hypothetical protein
VTVVSLVVDVALASGLWTFVTSSRLWSSFRDETFLESRFDVSKSVTADLFVSITSLDGAWIADLIAAEFSGVASTHLDWAVVALVNKFRLLIAGVAVFVLWLSGGKSIAARVNLNGSWAVWEFAGWWAGTFPVAAVSSIVDVTSTGLFWTSMASLLGGVRVKAFWIVDLNVSKSGTAVFWHGTEALFAFDTFSVAAEISSGLITETGHDWAFSASPLSWSKNSIPAFWILGLELTDSVINWSWTRKFDIIFWFTRTDPITTISNVSSIAAAGLGWAIEAGSFKWRNGGSETFRMFDPDVIPLGTSSVFGNLLWTFLGFTWITNFFATSLVLQAGTSLGWTIGTSFFTWNSASPALWMADHSWVITVGSSNLSWAFSGPITVDAETFPVATVSSVSSITAASLLWTNVVAADSWVHSFSVTFWIVDLSPSVFVTVDFFSLGTDFTFLVTAELNPRLVTETSLLWADVTSSLSWFDSFVPTFREVFLETVWIWTDKSSWIVTFSHWWLINTDTFPVATSSNISMVARAGDFWTFKTSSLAWSWSRPLETFWEDSFDMSESRAANFFWFSWAGLNNTWLTDISATWFGLVASTSPLWTSGASFAGSGISKALWVSKMFSRIAFTDSFDLWWAFDLVWTSAFPVTAVSG